ncbi:MAG: FKBP-type peptidyl-prolyl cis-trans isomerase [Paludibacter sp.]
MRKIGFLFVTLFFFGFVSCVKQMPQLPSNKVIERNMDNETLLKINSKLTEKEDSTIRILAESKGSFRKNQLGFWYKIFHTGKGTAVKDSVQCSFDFQIMKLDNKLINSGFTKIIIGKKQSIIGLEEGLKMMHKGDSAIFIIPWYLAYGMTGNDMIPPYTSLIYRIKLRI